MNSFRQLPGLAAFAFVALLLGTGDAHANDGTANMESLLKDGALGIIDWLGKIDGKLDKFVNAEKNRRIVTKLENLNRDLDQIEVEKTKFLKLVNQDVPDKQAILNQAPKLSQKIGNAAASIGSIGPDLSMIDPGLDPAGYDVERTLRKAIDGKHDWVKRLQLGLAGSQPYDKALILKVGNEALKSLEEARNKLVTLIAKLKAKSVAANPHLDRLAGAVIPLQRIR